MRYTESMALFVRQNDERTKYQQQIAAELQEKLRKRSEEAERPDGVTDSAFIKNTKAANSLGWIWIVVVAVLVLIAIGLLIGL